MATTPPTPAAPSSVPPSQQPVPTGTTPPGKRRVVAVVFFLLVLIVGYQLLKRPSTQPRMTPHDDGRDTPASEEQIRAAKAAGTYETEQEKEARERAEALKRAHGQQTASTPAPSTPTPAHAVAHSGGGGGGTSRQHSASSIAFDVKKEQNGGAGSLAPLLANAVYRKPDLNPADAKAARDRLSEQQAIAMAQQLMAAGQQQPQEPGTEQGTGLGSLAQLATAGQAPQSSGGQNELPGGLPDGELATRPPLLAPDPSWPRVVLPEDTVIEGVLKNRLEGAGNGPVDVMVTTNVYQRGTHNLIFPQGTNIAGESKRVASLNQERLAVFFHRALVQLADGTVYGVSLHDPGLDQAGGVGLHDKVNHQYVQIFGASLAVGAVGGLSNIGNTYGGAGGYGTLSSIRTGIGSEMGESAQRIMEFYLNRLPEIQIHEGNRVKIMLAGDLEVPLYPEQMEER